MALQASAALEELVPLERTRFFVVDDDPNILRLVSANLEARGHQAFAFTSGAMALSQLDHLVPDLVILDVLLPEMDGIELVKRIRQVSQVPILMLSARAETSWKLQALNRGADDYLTKPFGMGELLARVKAILRRSAGDASSQGGAVHIWDGLTVDMGATEVLRSARKVKLTHHEWALLRTLSRTPARW